MTTVASNPNTPAASLRNGTTNGTAVGSLSLPPSSPAAFPSSGKLNVTILSAYDLPAYEQPIAVTLSVNAETVSTAAPSARHKDRNSFKFGSALQITTPRLQELYKSHATLTVLYRNADKNLSADIKLDTLKVNETTWLILNLGPFHDADEVAPTLRLQARLEGPYRPEIGALLQLGEAWFGVVDKVEGGVGGVLQGIPAMPDKKYFLIPAVPLVTGLVVLSPVVVGVLIVGLPFFLPIVAIVLTTLIAGAGVGGVLMSSTTKGREYVGSMLSPMVSTLLSTSSGQRLVYETGPRPTPVSVARVVVPKDLMGKLMLSLLIDLLGSASYLIPVAGEVVDIAWAPMQTILIMAMYDQTSPNLKYVSFMEEILPFTDVIPSATIGWLAEFGPGMISGKQQNHSSAAGANTAGLMTAPMTPTSTPATARR